MTRQLEPAAPVELTGEQREKFLELIRADTSIGNIAALRQAGAVGTRGQLRALLDTDLAQDAREARGYGDQQIRNEIARRAIEGVDEPVFHNGEIVGHVRKYSDRLLGQMAKAHLPEYRDSGDLNVNLAGRVEVEDRSATLDAVAQVLRAVGALRDSSGPAGPALPAAPEVLAPASDG